MKQPSFRKSCAPVAVVAMLAGLCSPAFAQQQAPAQPQATGAGAGDAPRQCTREERDVNADCGRDFRDFSGRSFASGRRGPPKEVAPVDFTGYWESVITEDWRWRALTPPKGDYASIPISDQGKKLADSWDPKDVDSCKVFGAAALMRNPTRVRFTWQDDNTLKVESDHGEQIRVFHFNDSGADPGPPSLQGHSVASWDQSGLKVVTTNLSGGYLRKNGVQYSDKTRVTEYYNKYSAFGDDWMTVTTIVEDPVNLTRSWNTSLDFKKLKDNGASWHPTPCKG